MNKRCETDYFTTLQNIVDKSFKTMLQISRGGCDGGLDFLHALLPVTTLTQTARKFR